MFDRQNIRLVMLAAWLPLLLSMRTSAQETFPRQRRGVVSVNQRQHLFGIMGQVAHPGVYELDHEFPSLVELIKRAGGLVDDASGSIRIVRNGRSDQRLFYSSKLQFRMIPGDVIVVDSKQSGRSSAGLVVFSKANQSQSKSSKQVQLAFVNLIDRPVVLKTSQANATVQGIVSLLGQSAEIVSSVRVISNRGPRPKSAEPNATNLPLPSGTALIFDRSQIVTSRIPELPGIISANSSPSTNEADKKPASEEILPPKPFVSAPNVTETDQEVTIPEPKSEKPVLTIDSAAANTVESTGPSFSNLVETLKPPVPNQTQSSAIELSESSSANETVTDSKAVNKPLPQISVAPLFTEQSSELRPPETSESETEQQIEMTNGDDANETTSNQEQHSLHFETSTSPSNRVEKESDHDLSAASNVINHQPMVRDFSPKIPDQFAAVVGIVGFAAIAFSCWILISMARRATHSEQRPSKQVKKTNIQLLDAIINDELILEEEPPRLPERLTLFGQPVDQPILRLDVSSERPKRPHFLNPSPQRASARETVFAAEGDAVAGVNESIYDTVAPPEETEKSDSRDRSANWQDMDEITETKSEVNEALGLLDRVLSNLKTEGRR